MAKKLCLDAGHGLTTSGKQTCTGAVGVVKEWTMNNNVCNFVADMLKDYDVDITRIDDITGKTDVPVQSRTNKVNAAIPDLFISIHHNANTGVWGNWSYVVGFYHYKKLRDKDLAAFVAELSKLTGI
jgi:N-acetylmuramoyl-L-alanine amidase